MIEKNNPITNKNISYKTSSLVQIWNKISKTSHFHNQQRQVKNDSQQDTKNDVMCHILGNRVYIVSMQSGPSCRHEDLFSKVARTLC